MSDLSNLLGDVYGAVDDGPPVRRELSALERAPEWASDRRLEEAFADWEPEDRFPADRKAMPPVDDDLAAALSAALSQPRVAPPVPQVIPAPVVAAPVVPAPVDAAPRGGWTAPATPPAPAPPPPPPVALVPHTVSAPVVAQATFWAPGDDDIYPGGRAKAKAKAKH